MCRLGCNSIGVDGAIALAAALKDCPSLQTIESVGARPPPCRSHTHALTPGVAARVRYSSLSSNAIGDDGAKALIRALKHCPTLTLLQYGRPYRPAPPPRCAVMNMPGTTLHRLSRNNISASVTKQLEHELRRSAERG